MKHGRNLARTTVAAAAMLALAAGPAHAAAPTAILKDDASGAAYSGNVRLTLTSAVAVSTSLGTASCNRGNIDATVGSDGSNLNVSVYTFYNDPGPACTNSAGGSSTTSPVGLPWNGGDISYDSASGTGTLRINSVQVTSTSSTIFGTIVCNYRGTGTGNSITFSLANSSATAQVKASATNASLTKVDAGSSFLCPGTATYSAAFDVQGETTPGSGTYDQKLFLTS